MDGFITLIQSQLFESIVLPTLYRLDLMSFDEEAFDGLYWIIVGVLQIGLTYALLRPLEAFFPLERWATRRATRVDILYTWLAKMGLLNLVFFVMLQPVFDRLKSALTMHGIPSLEPEAFWPDIAAHPLLLFLLYVVVLDFAGYWYHRWEHRLGIWWELHAVHHSQRDMSFWTEDRNHVLDAMLQALFFSAIALGIGVSPGQYVFLMAWTNFLQNLQHANVRLVFPRWLAALTVSPAFHRRHHAIGYGHEGRQNGCNFGVLLPWWDMLFGTAAWDDAPEPTGIRDQLPTPLGCGRDYGSGFWSQQFAALDRIARRLKGARGWAYRRASLADEAHRAPGRSVAHLLNQPVGTQRNEGASDAR